MPTIKLLLAGGVFLASLVLVNGQTNSLSGFPTPGAQPTIAPIGTPAPLPTLAPYPAPAALPTMPANSAPISRQSPTPKPAASPTPLPDGTMPLPLPVMPTPIPLLNSQPQSSPASGTSATPLPDGTMPLPLPPMPTPVPLPDAQTLSEQLNLPTPTQMTEPLEHGQETDKLKESESLALKQKMAQADFIKSLDKLIAQQRNPAVADMTLEDAEKIALKQNPTILNAAQQIRLTQGQFVTVRAQAIPQLNLSSAYNQQGMELASNGRSSGGTITIPNPGGKPIVIHSGGGEVQNKQGTFSWPPPS